ncbi:HNH endonuclease signature motif containing protein [Xanthobacter sediminis]
MKEADAHYQTPEHRAWAAGVIRRAGGRCQHPGCTITRADGKLYADHIVEIKGGGAPLDPANGQALCARHHGVKTAQERVRRMAEPLSSGNGKA